MEAYTVSLNLLENIRESETDYLACILFNFTNREQPPKLAVDTKNIILSKYRSVTKHRDIIRVWIDLLSNIPSSIELVNVDLDQYHDEEQLCLALCSHTKGAKNMIVYSLASLNVDVDDGNCVNHNGCKIRIFDRDEACKVLNERNVVYISNSQVAGGNICKSKNTIGNGK